MPTDEPSKYRVPLRELESGAHVHPDDVITQQAPTPPSPHDEAAGHLPGSVRPFAV